MPIKYFRSTDTKLVLKDTTKLQKTSLDLFAEWLGYEWWDSKGKYKVNTNSYFEGETRGMKYISLHKMQLWYNREFTNEAETFPWHGEDVLVEVSKRLSFTVDRLQSAIDSKLVITTHLQYSKKQSKLLCTNHQIKIKE